MCTPRSATGGNTHPPANPYPTPKFKMRLSTLALGALVPSVLALCNTKTFCDCDANGIVNVLPHKPTNQTDLPQRQSPESTLVGCSCSGDWLCLSHWARWASGHGMCFTHRRTWRRADPGARSTSTPVRIAGWFLVGELSRRRYYYGTNHSAEDPFCYVDPRCDYPAAQVSQSFPSIKYGAYQRTFHRTPPNADSSSPSASQSWNEQAL